LLTMESRDKPRSGAPFRTWLYLLSGTGRIAAWRAADVLAAPAPAE